MNITANNFYIWIKERSFFVWSICFIQLKFHWIYTNAQKKGYKILYYIILLSAGTNAFGNCICYACCLLVAFAEFEPSSMKRNFGRSIWRNCMTCTISHLSGDVGKIINVMERENIESSSNFNSKPHIWSTNALHNSPKMVLTQRSSGKYAFLTLTVNFLSFDVPNIFQSFSFIF